MSIDNFLQSKKFNQSGEIVIDKDDLYNWFCDKKANDENFDIFHLSYTLIKGFLENPCKHIYSHAVEALSGFPDLVIGDLNRVFARLLKSNYRIVDLYRENEILYLKLIPVQV